MDDNKTEALLSEQTPTRDESEAAKDLEAAESHVDSHADTETVQTKGTMATFASMMTKPTVPGQTKTSVGAAAASFAASLDNASNQLGKSMKKMGEQITDTYEKTLEKTLESTEKLCKAEEPTKTVINGDKTVDGTDYVSFNDGPKETPRWKIVTGGAVIATLCFMGIFAAVPGSKLNQAIRDAKDNTGSREKMTVGFIGNSYLYVNDVPRVVESLAQGSITQQSVINTGASLGRLLRSGNGMYELWATEAARVELNETSYKDFVGEEYDLYDMGMCTVPQLLEGYDQYLTYKNYNGAYYNNGNNPCFVDEFYLTIINDIAANNPLYFDYVVLNDLTRLVADEEERQDSIEALMYAYAPMLRVAHAVPILVDTHSFYWDYDDGTNETHYGTDVAAFTSKIYAGIQEYKAALGSALPEKLEPKIAPVGLAYLTIYEENKKMYSKLFASDAIHASAYGTYLFATILYCTIYNRMPPAIGSEGVEEVFTYSRQLLDANLTVYPTNSEANYLRRIANRVTLQGYLPKTLVIQKTEQYDELVGNQTEGEYEGDGMDRNEQQEEQHSQD